MTRTSFLSALGTTYPIIQAPMAGVQGSDLAIAVSNAGGLGSLPAAMLSPDRLRDELEAVSSGTSKPYNVNFFCHTPPIVDAGHDAGWRELLQPYYRELGIDPSSIQEGPRRTPFDHTAADVLEVFKPPVVSFHFGLPSAALLDRIKRWRPVILSSATTVEEARWLVARGADAIIAQGFEAGGHRGMFLSDDLTRQVGTLALVPQIVHAVNVPVIAAGGIADAAGVGAALTLGAAAVQIGTAYLLCSETTTTRVHRDALAATRAQHTAVTNVFTGRPARAIVNRLIVELGPMNTEAPAFPRAFAAIAPLRAKAEAEGSGEFSPLWAGQNVSGCRAVPAATLTSELAARAS